MTLSGPWEIVKDREACHMLQSAGLQRVGHALDPGQQFLIYSQSVGSLPSANYVINRVLGLGVPTLNK